MSYNKLQESNSHISNILLVVHGFNIVGGALNRTTNLVKNLHKYKTNVSILATSFSKETYTNLIRLKLSNVYCIRKNKSHERIPTGLDIFSISSTMIACLKYLWRYKCDLIYVRYPNPENMLACFFVSILKKKPLIIELHHHLGTFEDYTFLRVYLRMIEKLLIILSNKVIVNSWTFYRELMSIYGENICKKVYVVPNSIDVNLFPLHKGHSSASIKSSQQVIGFIGTLKPDEDLLGLTKAAKIVLQKYQNAVFIIIGQDMGLKNELENEIERLGLKGRFLLIDKKPYREIPGILKTFSVFVAPRVNNKRTRYAIPIKILEAMASGVPVVATSLPPIEELTDDAAILVPPSDHVSLADEIIKLLKDHNLRKELIKKGLKRAKKFDSEKITSYFAKVLTY